MINCLFLKVLVRILLLFAAGHTFNVHAAAPIPTPPVISWMPSDYSKGDTVRLAWGMWWGTPGTYWQIWVNNLQVGGNITTFKYGTPTNFSVQQQEVGLYETTALTRTVGTQNLTIRLCNSDNVCVASKNKMTLNVTAPTPPVISSMPSQYAKGDTVKLAWGMWWGTPGTYWQIFLNNVQVGANITTFKNATPTNFSLQQQQEVSLYETKALTTNVGTHTLTIKLCSSNNVCTASSNEVILNVTPPGAVQPAAPVMKLTDYRIVENDMIKIWWAADLIPAGTYWQLFSNDVQVGGNIFDFRNTFEKQEGSTVTKVGAPGVRVIYVKLCNSSNMCTTSTNKLTLTVVASGGPPPAQLDGILLTTALERPQSEQRVGGITTPAPMAGGSAAPAQGAQRVGGITTPAQRVGNAPPPAQSAAPAQRVVIATDTLSGQRVGNAPPPAQSAAPAQSAQRVGIATPALSEQRVGIATPENKVAPTYTFYAGAKVKLFWSALTQSNNNTTGRSKVSYWQLFSNGKQLGSNYTDFDTLANEVSASFPMTLTTIGKHTLSVNLCDASNICTRSFNELEVDVIK